ncbi:MAG: hypothetical protein V9F02_10640 [Chitinophagaceae bacterium]
MINSQEAALIGFEDNYRKRTGNSLPFTFAKYTGQEKQDYRDKVAANPPDILLTNYMMLELLMVRKADEDLRKSFLDNNLNIWFMMNCMFIREGKVLMFHY